MYGVVEARRFSVGNYYILSVIFFSLKRSGYALSSVCFLCESPIRGEIHFAPNFVVRASLDRFL